MIERARKRRQAVTRNSTVCRRNAGHTAERGGLTNRPAGIGAERQHRGSLRDHRRRSAARSARYPIWRDRIPHRAECRVFIRRPHGELIAIRLAENYAAGLLDALYRGRIIGRNVVLEKLRSAGGAHAACEDDVLNGDWHASERARFLARENLLIHLERGG